MKYKEIRGTLVKKYRNLFGQCVLVIDDNITKVKVYVGAALFERLQIGTKWTIGYLGKKMINIRPGFCKNGDAE